VSSVTEALQELRAAPIADRGRPTLHVVDLVEKPGEAGGLRLEVLYTIDHGSALWGLPFELVEEDLPPAGSDVTLAEYIAAEVVWRLREQRDAPLGEARLVS
jgi:hypothetical protein